MIFIEADLVKVVKVGDAYKIITLIENKTDMSKKLIGNYNAQG